MAQRRFRPINYPTTAVEVNDLTAAVVWANVPDANITQSSVTQHEAALTITESQISDLGNYLPIAGGTLTGNLTIDTDGVGPMLSLSDGAGVSGDELLRFNIDRAWAFKQRNTGAGTALDLQSITDAKNFNMVSAAGTAQIVFGPRDAASPFINLYNSIGTNYVQHAVSGTSEYQTSLVSLNWQIDGGSVNFDTNTGVHPFYISRLGTTTEALSIVVDDNDVIFTYAQDETTGAKDVVFNFDMNANVATHSFELQYEGSPRHRFYTNNDRSGYYMFGGEFRVYDDTVTDFIQFYHDGTSGYQTFANSQYMRIDMLNTTNGWAIEDNGAFKFWVDKVNTNVDIRDGYTLRVRNSTDAAYMDMSHDGTDFNLTATGTTEVNLNTQLKITKSSGPNIVFRDSDSLGNDNASVGWLRFEGSDAVRMGFVGFGSSGNKDIYVVSDNGNVRLIGNRTYPAGQTTGYLEPVTTSGFGSIQVDGAQGGGGSTWEGYNVAGRCAFMFNNTEERGGMYDDINNRWAIQWNAENATADEKLTLYAGSSARARTQVNTASGTTSGMELLDHGNTWQDVGFNVLPTFNSNVSDTLEARHCGSIQRRTTTTARTLTLAASTDTDFPVDGVTTVTNTGASGNYTINEGTGTTLYFLNGSAAVDTAGGCTLGPGGVATILRVSTTAYYIWGAGITA